MAPAAASMLPSQFDDRHIQWRALGDFPHLVASIFFVDEGVVNLIVRVQSPRAHQNVSVIVFFKQPRRNWRSLASSGICSASPDDRRARRNDAGADGSVGQWGHRLGEIVEHGREI